LPIPFLGNEDKDELNDFGLETIDLKNMHNARCVTDILDFFRGSSKVHIAHCPLDPDYSCNNGELSLKEIDRGGDLVPFLSACARFAGKLVMGDCPSFGNAVLNAMISPKSCAPYVEDLSILNCLDFSISTLKQLFETRRTQSDPNDVFAVRRGRPRHITVLRLSGRVPEVSLQDREWFKRRLSEFSYNAVQ
jgi:hypothetical protein